MREAFSQLSGGVGLYLLNDLAGSDLWWTLYKEMNVVLCHRQLDDVHLQLLTGPADLPFAFDGHLVFQDPPTILRRDDHVIRQHAGGVAVHTGFAGRMSGGFLHE